MFPGRCGSQRTILGCCTSLPTVSERVLPYCSSYPALESLRILLSFPQSPCSIPITSSSFHMGSRDQNSRLSIRLVGQALCPLSRFPRTYNCFCCSACSKMFSLNICLCVYLLVCSSSISVCTSALILHHLEATLLELPLKNMLCSWKNREQHRTPG